MSNERNGHFTITLANYPGDIASLSKAHTDTTVLYKPFL